ncbi:MAG: Tm-1-like ATP-binding domain-containing protein [Deltaproteobacteria bacterium]|nr:Tm-1-like ATP-binding domain-containing protein [Deltaproteobacteria bacterium]
MAGTIAIISTLDTKGEEAGYLKNLIEKRGHHTIVIDVGILGEPYFEPDVSKKEVAGASGSSIEALIATGDEAVSMERMAAGTARITTDLYTKQRLDGALALGGSMGTSLALKVMKGLPIGFPKLIISTIAFSPLIPQDEVAADLMMILWAGGLRGINRISRRVLHVAAGAIAGAVEEKEEGTPGRKKVVGITCRGAVSSQWITRIKQGLEERGYELEVFHATGMGGRAFEQAIAEGLIDVALDLSTGELTDHVCGGFCSAGKGRMEAAGRKGIPQIVAGGSSGTFLWRTDQPIPGKYQGRSTHVHNSLITVIGTSTEERAQVGKVMAEKLNRARGPAAVVIPMDRPPKDPSGSFYSPEGLMAFKRALKDTIKPHIKVVELDTHINDSLFSDTVMALFDEMTAGRNDKNE